MDDESRRRRWLALARVPGAVAAGAVRRYVSRGGDVPGTRLAAAFEGGEVDGEENRWGAVLAEARTRLETVDDEIARGERAGARLIDVEDAEYPALLKGIADPPPALFVRGRIEPGDARAAAVIGSRDATRYGISITARVVPPLAARGVTVVSGMARGIDAAAHRAALRGGGRTIAVLGTGIDVCYPRSSRDLYEQIPAQGAVISEVAPGTVAAPWLFPPRNRIVAGLAKVVVIVEARARSGTSVTAKHALDQGREVGVVPGDVDLARSAGTNALLSQGAFPVRGAEDVLVFGFDEAVIREEAPRSPVLPPGLDGDGTRIWAVLGREAATLETVVAKSGLGAGTVMAALGRLERAGLVSSDGWGRYALRGAAEARR